MNKFACIISTAAALAIFASASDARAFTYGLWRSGMTVEEANQALADEHQTVKLRSSASNFDVLVTEGGDVLDFCHGVLISFSRNIPDKFWAFSTLEDMKKAGKPKIEENSDPVFGKSLYTYRLMWINEEGFTGIDTYSTKPLDLGEIKSADELASKINLTREGFRKVWWKEVKCEPK